MLINSWQTGNDNIYSNSGCMISVRLIWKVFECVDNTENNSGES